MKKNKNLFLCFLSFVICVPLFAQDYLREYTPKTNFKYKAKAFSVSSTNKVYFTQGNLIVQNSYSSKLAFATHQYDVFYPHTTTAWEGYHLFVSTQDYFFSSSDIENTNKQNTIKYRCLSVEEFEYLLEKRTNAHNLQSFARVNGTVGYILLPDNWTCPANITFVPMATCSDPSNPWVYTNTYENEEWEKMEAVGAVFLPINYFNVYGSSIVMAGIYWTKTSLQQSLVQPVLFMFLHNQLPYCKPIPRGTSEKAAIRLVYDVK